MSNCPDFCSAAKCRELENRIGILEQDLAFLRASFNSHVQQEIPTAHDYDSNIRIDGSYQSNILTLTVADKTSQDTATISIPDSNVTVSLATNSNDNTLKVFVAVGSKNDSETVTLPEPNDDVDVSLAVNSDDNTLKVFVKVGDKSDEETVTLPKPETNLKLDGSFADEMLTLTVADGSSQDTAQILIPIPNIDDLINDLLNKLPKSNLKIDGSYFGDDLTITVSDGQSSDTFQVTIPRRSGGGEENRNDFLSGNGNLTEEGILRITINSSIGSANILVDFTMLKKILDYSEIIYKILGGGVWAESGETGAKTVSLELNPEAKIKEFGQQLYNRNNSELNELTATNLLDLTNIYEAVNYYRNGFHRLPAKTLKSLINNNDGNQEITIYDTFSWQEYLIKQVDALVGEFPIKIKYQGVDSAGEPTEQDIELGNISVAIAEILGLNLTMAHDADVAVNIGMKTLIEARNAANAAIVAVDYGQANAEYLGYKGNQTQKEVDCTFTPLATNLRDALRPSTQKIIGWSNEDKETLIEFNTATANI